MRHRWGDLSTWQGCVTIASSLHERDGFPKRSPAPTPKMDACLSPTPLCIDSGWCVGMCGVDACTAPEGYVPSEYATEAASVCPARRTNARAAQSAQTSHGAWHPNEPLDAETLAVLRWVKNTLVSVAVGEMPQDVREYAASLLHDKDRPTTMAACEALGREMVRRYRARFPEVTTARA